MAWMRLEVSYIDHPKFVDLSDGAFRLWHEGKSYCEKHLTDGLIREAAARGFRHFSERRLKELQAVVVGYSAPLWESHDVGFKMHDYLDHNDSRDVALARMAKSRDEKQRKLKNQHAFRARKQAERESVTGDNNGDGSGDSHRENDTIVSDRTETASTSSSSKQEHSDRAVAAPRPPRFADDDEPNYRVILKTAHDAIDIEGIDADLATLKDAVKSLCKIRELNVGLTGELVNKAIDSALWQRTHPAPVEA